LAGLLFDETGPDPIAARTSRKYGVDSRPTPVRDPGRPFLYAESAGSWDPRPSGRSGRGAFVKGGFRRPASRGRSSPAKKTSEVGIKKDCGRPLRFGRGGLFRRSRLCGCFHAPRGRTHPASPARSQLASAIYIGKPSRAGVAQTVRGAPPAEWGPMAITERQNADP